MCAINLVMKLSMMDQTIVEITMYDNAVTANLYSINGVLKGDVDIKLGYITSCNGGELDLS